MCVNVFEEVVINLSLSTLRNDRVRQSVFTSGQFMGLDIQREHKKSVCRRTLLLFRKVIQSNQNLQATQHLNNE